MNVFILILSKSPSLTHIWRDQCCTGWRMWW